MNALRTIQEVFSRYKILALLIAIALIWAFFTWQSEGAFLTSRNISNLFRQMAITAMLACGMVFVIIAGEIDLSVGSMLGLLGGVAAVLDVSFQVPFWANLCIVLTLGMLLGLFNGYWVAYLRVPSFIVGLAGMLVFRGALLAVTDGATIPIESKAFVGFGQAYLPAGVGYVLAVLLFGLMVVLTLRTRAGRRRYQLEVAPWWQEGAKLAAIAIIIGGFVSVLNSYEGIPVPVLLMLVILGAFSFMARRTVFGRRIYAVGSNLEATRLSGVNTKLVKMSLFGLMGAMCALAGLTNTARLAAGSPSAGNMGELDAIASCFIGGTSMRGGSGTVLGAIIGALIMASLDNGMSMLSVESYWQMIVKGSILLLAVWLDVVSSKGSER
ncbi:MAG: sugar ABC transporter permease [Candidatus Dactylopiibacterium carminicum]|uniref:Xylose transport system permease protein XylH n=1 Tax=Candidatus Dactylopiibacterium carminicum TaxID=857335 RepID=A0A272EW04_9RHOO|nr:sugar ABC transporter permease [Candidatus Dactylopiibacterium carminicum]KAF7599512.1 sugar ABC transporter permease [Candidatus Dactylopiibacterium carminicum]PAS94294.1 MAG: sugar ABC transporter permease [Candidatus Dactylopiibacterium carminicum]PAS98489.1 MAG: sugar ABC transporter permease [Candidatus Dactylopiibacterium carminicum]PAS99518.1 MAG: sugar ABC transporter permease [Candidatus Dactylopiibacterium carminicum]